MNRARQDERGVWRVDLGTTPPLTLVIKPGSGRVIVAGEGRWVEIPCGAETLRQALTHYHHERRADDLRGLEGRSSYGDEQ